MSMAFHMDITVDISTKERMKAGAVEVIRTVRPSWEQELVEWKVFSDGITNKLLGAWCRDKMDMVLVRVYGAGTEKIIDRKVELENMCCQGDTLGGDLEELKLIIEQVENKERIGVCLDTCHAMAAGYDLSVLEGFERLCSEFETKVGWQWLVGVHVNDSLGPAGSHR